MKGDKKAALFGFISNASLYMINVNFSNHPTNKASFPLRIIHLNAKFILSI